MKSDYKTACILIDENDLGDFKNSYQHAIPKGSLWVSLDSFSTMQVIFQEFDKSYYIPKVIDNGELATPKGIYQESQKFLKQLLLDNKIIDEAEDSFPLEYFWFCFWTKVYRTILFCNDLLSQFSIKEVILIKRNKFLNHGGILISTASFINLIEDFFKNRGVRVKILKDKRPYLKPKTIFYSQKCSLKPSLKHLVKLIYWKMLSFNKKNHNYILINPKCDNVVNYHKTFNSANKMFPQVFHGARLPFLHSWIKSLRFLIKKGIFKYKYSDNNRNIVSPYKSNLCNFEFDFAEVFQGTIIQYLKDVRWMRSYISMFWESCLENKRQYLIIFSLSPAHLDSYFLFKKTKENSGKLAVWQHGGVYGYTDYVLHYLTDYKNADYFLSFGKNNINDVTKYFSDNNNSKYAPVGTNVIYESLNSRNSRIKKLWSSQGLFIPAVVSSVYSQGRINWRGDLQFETIKDLIDYFEREEEVKFIVKGMKRNKVHEQLHKYIEMKKLKNIFYTDISLSKALAKKPRFVIIDNPSTPLLQTLAHYDGPVFLMINQKYWAPRKDALVLLKRRVVYSESVDELKIQLTKFFKEGTLNGVNTEDASFRDVYLKKFCYLDYERFLQEATSTPQ